MEILWHKQARADLRAIREFYDDIDPSITARMMHRIFDAGDQLLHNPRIGRPGRAEGTREWLIKGTPFLMGYKLSGEQPIVLAIYHAAQEWPTIWLAAAASEATAAELRTLGSAEWLMQPEQPGIESEADDEPPQPEAK